MKYGTFTRLWSLRYSAFSQPLLALPVKTSRPVKIPLGMTNASL